MNIQLLEEKIKKSGLKYEFIAQSLKITEAGLRKKRAGISEFKASEVKKLIKLLKLTSKDVDEIFFENVRHY